MTHAHARILAFRFRLLVLILALALNSISQPSVVEAKAKPKPRARAMAMAMAMARSQSHVTLPDWMRPLGNVCTHDLFNLDFMPSPEAHLTTPQIIARHGYPVETHHVTSKDGYILTLFRIPHGKKDKDTKTKENFPAEAEATKTRPAIILHHGLLVTSSDWFMLPEEKALPYMLANAGYDVWLANARGTTYSKKHTHLRSASLEYWKFSFHEMGNYDLPVLIDYILDTTKEPKLYYAGHSMGGTIFFIAMSLHPEYNAKIRSMYGLAPAAYTVHMSTPALGLTHLLKPIQLVQEAVGYGGLFPPFTVPLVNSFGPLACAPTPVALTVCSFFFFALGGYDPCQLNGTQQISNILGHTPDTASARTLEHYLQIRKSTRFRPFDYMNAEENMSVYGRERPPDYNLTKVTAKVAVFWGQNDILVTPRDTARLMKELPNLIANYRVPFDLWTHMDFIYGIDAKEFLYDEMLKLMAKNY